MLQFETLNIEKHYIKSKHYAVTYYQTLEEFPWILKLEKPLKWNFEKL